jgi:hypothetical protein
MAVRVAGPRRSDGHSRPDRVDEGLRGGGPAAMVRDLEQIDMWQIVLQQRRVDPFLDVAHQQEPPLPDMTEEDDRDVIDAGAAVRRDRRDLAANRP